MLRRLTYILIILLLLPTVSCRKKVSSSPPPPLVQPVASPPAAPSVSLIADRTAIEAGQSVALEWKTENANSLRISELGDVDLTGRVQVAPRESITYTATATGPGGTASDTVRITVSAPEREPEKNPTPDPVLSLDEDFRNKIPDVYFDYDRAELRPDQSSQLDVLVRWLGQNLGSRVMIEGHCDERGSAEYNLGLGDLRASNVRAYLMRAGISSDRFQIISYGEERPICSEQNESCWSRNRRAHFVLAGTP